MQEVLLTLLLVDCIEFPIHTHSLPEKGFGYGAHGLMQSAIDLFSSSASLNLMDYEHRGKGKHSGPNGAKDVFGIYQTG